MNIRRYLQVLTSIPATIWFNFRIFPLAIAIHLPVLVYRKTKFIHIQKGCVNLEKKNFGTIKIGFPHRNYPARSVLLDIRGKIIFKGSASIQPGCEFNVLGRLEIGDGFGCVSNTKIDAKEYSVFGKDVLIGPECYFSDDDGHFIYREGKHTNPPKGYIIGDHVWFGRGVMVLKGTIIGNDCVVGAGSVISGKHYENNAVFVGNPAICIRDDITWQK